MSSGNNPTSDRKNRINRYFKRMDILSLRRRKPGILEQNKIIKYIELTSASEDQSSRYHEAAQLVSNIYNPSIPLLVLKEIDLVTHCTPNQTHNSTAN